jgi:hypothetical protein
MQRSTIAGHVLPQLVGRHQSRHRHRWQRPENGRYEHQQRAWTIELTWVTALQSAAEFAGTADEDPVLSTINPTTMIVPAIIDRITISLVGAAPTNQRAYPRSPVDHAVADCICIKYRCPKNFDRQKTTPHRSCNRTTPGRLI